MQLANSFNGRESQEYDRVKELVSSVVALAGSVVTETSPRGRFEHEKKDNFNKIVGVHRLQRSIVKQNMHNAMSPISAISGYLELINMSLLGNPDVEKIESYRKKIESGVAEVNSIIEQLQDIYSQDLITSGPDTQKVEVDLNWLITDVLDNMYGRRDLIELDTAKEPLHISTDLFIAKLIIFNLINYAGKVALRSEGVHISSDKEAGSAVLMIEFTASEQKRTELASLFRNSDNSRLPEGIEENSFNDGILSSISLAEEIDANLTFMSVKSGQVVLKLSVEKAR